MPAAPHPHHAHSYPFDATSRYAAHPPSHNHSHSLPHSFDHYRPATHSVPLSPTIAANQGQAVLLTNPGVTPPTSGFAHRTVVPLAPLATTTTPTSNTGGTAGPSGSYHSPQHPLPSLPSVYATHKGDPPATGRTIQQTTPSLAATPILPNLTPLSTVIAHAAQVEPTSPSHPVLPAVQSAGPCSTAVTVATSGMVPSVADLPSSLRRHSASNNATLAPTAYHPRTEDPTEHVPRSVLQDLVDLRRCELDLQEKRMRTDQLLMARAEERDRDQRTFFESLLHQQNAFLERQSLSYERLLHQHMELCRKYFGDDRSSSYAGSALSSPLPSSPLDCTEGGSATCSSPTRVSKSPSATPMSSAPAAAVVTPNST
ncbi:hypothetical protein IWQ60_010005 [Tieghemiomyces parasiticus]|uniref:Uncharacterized protein n=1 Tax=Tieghemiomyces parasiticus TaxID=78921 RepID=A0A9W7ZS47_9FUNG|nr:hypothetical protein IWQ60_010005 [Tieghemiomyces parasiticus]